QSDFEADTLTDTQKQAVMMIGGKTDSTSTLVHGHEIDDDAIVIVAGTSAETPSDSAKAQPPTTENLIPIHYGVIYDRLCGSKDTGMPATITSAERLSALNGTTLNDLARKSALEEFVTTERKYNRKLQALQCYYEHIGERFEPEQTLKVYFASKICPPIKSILQISTRLVGSEMGSVKEFAQVMLDEAENFAAAYSPFVKKYPEAVETHWMIEKNYEFFTKFLKQIQTQDGNGNGVSFGSLLGECLQRLPRYVLLLETMLKATPSDHEDFIQIQEAALKVSDVVMRVERSQSTAHTHLNMLRLLSGFPPAR
ncbi:hypothetical protein HK102_003168, partial [Quaeritorhiza haematococci]